MLLLESIARGSGYYNTTFFKSPQSPPIAWKQVAETKVTANSNNVVDNPLTNVSAGDLIVCVMYINDSSNNIYSVTDTSGDTFFNAVGPTTGKGTLANWGQEIWYASNVVGGASVTVTAFFNATVNVEKDISCHEYSGAAKTNPFDVNAEAYATSSANPSSGSATTNFANELIFGAEISQSGVTAGAGAGFNSRSSMNSNSIEDKDVTSSGSYGANFSAASGDWIAQMATFVRQSSAGVIQNKSATSGGSTVNITVKATGTGNLIVVGVASQTGVSVVSVTDNASSGGNTYVSSGATGDDGSNNHSEIWYAKNSKPGATTITVTMSASSGNSSWVAEVSGMDIVSPLDVAQGINSTASVTLTSPQLTPSTSTSFIFSVGASTNGITGIHAGNPFIAQTEHAGDEAANYFSSVGGTYGAVWDQSSGKSASSTAAFRPYGTACGPIKLVQAVPGNTTYEVMNSPGNTKSQAIAETAGNILVAIAYVGQGGGTTAPNLTFNVSDTLGNTYYAGPYIDNSLSNASAIQIFFAPNIIGGANTVMAVSTTPFPIGVSTGLFLQEYSGAGSTNVVDVASAQYAPSTTGTATPGNATTTMCDMVVGGFVDGSQGGQELFAGLGWRQQSTDDWCPAGAVDDSPGLAPANSAVNANMNYTNGNTSNGWAATQVAFRASTTTAPAQPTLLAFTTGAQTLAATTCSGAVTVQSQNGSSAPTTTSTGIRLNLNASTNPAAPVEVQSATTNTATNSAALAFSSNTTAGNTILVFGSFAGGATPTISDTSGNTFSDCGPGSVKSAGGGDMFKCWYAPNIAGGADTVTISSAGATATLLFISEYSGADLLSPVDSAADTAWRIGPASSTTANDLLVSVGFNLAGAPSDGAAFTDLQHNCADICGRMEYASASSVNNVGVFGASNIPTDVFSVTLRPANNTGLTFYADSGCLYPTTSIFLGAGTNTQNFYFMSNGQGSPTLSVSATGFAAINQPETINAANAFTWIGGGGCSGNWPVPPGVAADKACWKGNAIPGINNVAHFDGTCTAPCNATITGNISVGGIWMHPTYAGVISQGANTITVTNNFEEDAGTFTGGTATMTVQNDFTLTGGNFTATSGNLVFTANSGGGANITVSGSPTFTANGGNVYIGRTTGGSNGPYSVTPGNITLNNLFITEGAWIGGATFVGTLNVNGNLTINTSGPPIFGGIIAVAGNVSVSNGGGSGPGTTAISFTGGNPQTFSVTSGGLPGGTTTVNKTAGTTVTLSTDMILSNTGQALTITSGILNLNGHNLTVRKDVTINDTLTAGSGTISLGGNWINSGTFTANTGSVDFTGNGKTIGGSATTTFNGLTISNGITLADPIIVNGNLTLASSSLTAAGNAISVGGNWINSGGSLVPGGNTVTFTSGASHAFTGAHNNTFYNLIMDDSGNAAGDTITFVHGQTTTVSHALTLAGNATNNLKLRSDSFGVQVNLFPPAGTTLGGHLDVQDSNSNAVIHSGANSVNSGNNNANWNFP